MTESDPRVRPAATLPQDEVIRAELIKIRGAREGLSEVTVERHGAQLQRLPAVTDEVLRNGLRPGSRPRAAAKVVRCAVNHLVKDPWKTFLTRTLLDTNNSLVSERITRAGAALGIESISQREVTDQRSYRELAGALVKSPGSPCIADVMQALAEHNAAITRHWLEIADLLSDLGMDQAADAQRRVAGALLEELPRGNRAIPPDYSVLDKVEQLLRAAIDQHGRRLDRSAYVEIQLVLYALLETVSAVAVETESGDEEVLEAAEMMEELSSEERAKPDYEIRLANSLTFIADALVYEEGRNWPSLTDPQNARLR